MTERPDQDAVHQARQSALAVLTSLASRDDEQTAALVSSWSHGEVVRVLVSMASYCDVMLDEKADQLGLSKQELLQWLGQSLAERSA